MEAAAFYVRFENLIIALLGIALLMNSGRQSFLNEIASKKSSLPSVLLKP